jgi:hypothetical protein
MDHAETLLMNDGITPARPASYISISVTQP